MRIYMKHDPEEKILLSQEEYDKLEQLISDPNPPEISQHLMDAINRSRQLFKSDKE